MSFIYSPLEGFDNGNGGDSDVGDTCSHWIFAGLFHDNMDLNIEIFVKALGDAKSRKVLLWYQVNLLYGVTVYF